MQTKAAVQRNGIEEVAATQTARSEVALSPAQQRHLNRLIAQLGRAQDSSEAAQKALEAAQTSANGFLDYCAEELGTTGWRFDQNRMIFVRPEVEEAENAEYNRGSQ